MNIFRKYRNKDQEEKIALFIKSITEGHGKWGTIITSPDHVSKELRKLLNKD